jgi:3-dehydroquinate synthase
MRKTELKTGNGEVSQIYVPSGMEDLPAICPPGKTALLVDDNVLKHHKAKLSDYLVINAGSGEESKTIANVARIYGRLIEAEVDRTWTIVGIGGGITTDLTGFAACTFLRGVRFGFVSTTLLGQVDASIGGKNGINYEGYKNMIGLISQPGFVMCDLNALQTLPEKEYIAGFAEIIKCGAIRRPDMLSYLQQNLERALAKDPEVLEHLVFESITTKVQVVEADEREQGERKILNFGHTFAHAIEKLYGLSHGEAVAIGMVMASYYSEKTGLLAEGWTSELTALLKKTGLPANYPVNPDDMAAIMRKDKKRKGGEIDLILLDAPGNAVIKSVQVDELKHILHDLC